MTHAEYQAKYRNPVGRVCLCGRPAVKCKLNQFVCARCLELESEYYRDTRKAVRLITPEHRLRLDRRAERFWIGNHDEFAKPKTEIGWGSLRELERRMAA